MENLEQLMDESAQLASELCDDLFIIPSHQETITCYQNTAPDDMMNILYAHSSYGTITSLPFSSGYGIINLI